MMQLKSLLTLDRTRCGITASNKRQALEMLANTIAESGLTLDAEDVLRKLLSRERLGSTGIGHGIAIPHCRCANNTGALGALITLTHPVEFDAIDAEPVDILFAMLVPEEAHDEHLKNLAALATKLTSDSFRHSLRTAKNNQELYDAAINDE
jgi:PTS system nitrogen regulatory IIA component